MNKINLSVNLIPWLRLLSSLVLCFLIVFLAQQHGGVVHAAEDAPSPALDNIIPRPASIQAGAGSFVLAGEACISVQPSTLEMNRIGQYLADRLNPATGLGLRVVEAGGQPSSGIYLTTMGGDPALGEEGYELTVTPALVCLRAFRPAGLFHGIQTIRQLLPPAIEGDAITPGPWQIPACTIRDYPRFAWRGVMLDVARHFFGVEDVKRYLDLLAYYKLNRFHLHLTDDQGWRLMIKSWPRLATHGGSTEVGGTPGGYYTQADYAEIVAYARDRYIMVVPEIDMPGHVQAALASYDELNEGNKAGELYTGTNVGFSSLQIDMERTYAFVEDVIRELAALTPGPYIHIGGDEAAATKQSDYRRFIGRVQEIVEAQGKRTIGWEETARAKLLPSTVIQHWNVDPALRDLAYTGVAQGVKVIMSPANRTYLDMKYDAATKLGLAWAGHVEVRDSYAWDPAGESDGVGEESILGVEAPLWTETLKTLGDLQYMTLPRLPGLAEIGWSQAKARDWEEYKTRLAKQGPRWEALRVNYYRSPQVPWK